MREYDGNLLSRISLKSCWVVLLAGSTIINYLLVLSSERTCKSLREYMTVQGPIVFVVVYDK
jgi:hypothetical protein